MTGDTSEIQLTLDVRYVLLEPTVIVIMQILALPVQMERQHHKKEAQAAHSVVRTINNIYLN